MITIPRQAKELDLSEKFTSLIKSESPFQYQYPKNSGRMNRVLRVEGLALRAEFRAGRFFPITLFRVAYDARITHNSRRAIEKNRLSHSARFSGMLV